MGNIRSFLSLVYRNISPEAVIKNILKDFEERTDVRKRKFIHRGFDRDEFNKTARETFHYYSTDQLSALFNRLSVDVYSHQKLEPQKPDELAGITSLNVFQLLNRFSQGVLEESDDGIVCNFDRLLGWREISHQLSEDLFTTAFLAERDLKFGKERRNFSWPDVIKTNNVRLNSILKRGLADNHFHLNASNPVFDLKWVFMMNNIFTETKKNIKTALDSYDKDYLSANVETSLQTSHLSLYDLCYIAAVLRVILYKWVNDENFLFFSDSYKRIRFAKLCNDLKDRFNKKNAPIQDAFSKTYTVIPITSKSISTLISALTVLSENKSLLGVFCKTYKKHMDFYDMITKLKKSLYEFNEQDKKKQDREFISDLISTFTIFSENDSFNESLLDVFYRTYKKHHADEDMDFDNVITKLKKSLYEFNEQDKKKQNREFISDLISAFTILSENDSLNESLLDVFYRTYKKYHAYEDMDFDSVITKLKKSLYEFNEQDKKKQDREFISEKALISASDSVLKKLSESEALLDSFCKRYAETPYTDESMEALKELLKHEEFNDITPHEKEQLCRPPSFSETFMYAWEQLYKLLKHDNSFSEPDYDLEMSDYIIRSSWLYRNKQIDYAMPNDFVGEEQHFLDGERRLMYDLFQRNLRNKPEDMEYLELFYLYLLIKIRLRQEIVQINNRYGFDNFSRYESRKDDMFDHMPQSQLYRYYYAINNLFKNENVESLELRIVPTDNAATLAKKIRDVEKVVMMDYHPSNPKPENVEVIMNDTGKLALKNRLEKPAPGTETITDKRDNLLKNNVYYVLHFPKERDTTTDNLIELANKYKEPMQALLEESRAGCRHYEYRNTLKRFADAIVKLRETDLSTANKIYGIDACSNELNCRPEVFAPVFRYLSNHRPLKTSILDSVDTEKSLQSLKMTYHVGEDFYDIIDGLRAIDEAVSFLRLKDGSRIGHGIALGVEARKWYEEKGKVIELPIQNLIDNLAWMHARIRRFGLNEFTSLSEVIITDFEFYYDRVYDLRLDNVNIRTYFDAWRMRGHDPTLFRRNPKMSWDAYEEDDKFEKRTIFSSRLNRNKLEDTYIIDKNNIVFDDYDNYRFNDEYGGTFISESISRLYYRYHYDNKAKIMGTRSVEYKITDDYIAAVEALQHMMRKKISDLHIAIETNPTSNRLISRMLRYEDHHILKLCEIDPSRDDSVQNFVSINTDDKGVFNTCIENEYALMACALEKKRNADGSLAFNRTQIYDWLDRVRIMGLEQSFKPYRPR